MKKIALVIFGLLVLVLVFTTACTQSVDNAMMDDSDSMMKQQDNSMHEQDAMTDNQDSMMQEEDNMMEEGDNMMEEQDSMMQQEDSMMSDYEGAVLAGEKTVYLDFKNADYQKALSENKIILLNFYASWCPSCKAENPDALAAFNQLDMANVVGFRVHYKDSETNSYAEDLAKEFGIAYQHTKVIIKDGKQVVKSPESWSTARYIEELQKV